MTFKKNLEYKNSVRQTSTKLNFLQQLGIPINNVLSLNLNPISLQNIFSNHDATFLSIQLVSLHKSFNHY